MSYNPLGVVVDLKIYSMPLRVQKNNRESSQGLVRRFSQKMRKSGILLEAKKRQFKKKPRSRTLRKNSALRRIQKKAEHERLNKLGEE